MSESVKWQNSFIFKSYSIIITTTMVDFTLMTTTAWLFFVLSTSFFLSFAFLLYCVCQFVRELTPLKAQTGKFSALLKHLIASVARHKRSSAHHLACCWLTFSFCQTVVQLFSCAMTLLWHDTHWFRANMVMTEEVRSGQRSLNMSTSHSRLSQVVLPKLLTTCHHAWKSLQECNAECLMRHPWWQNK